jgi:hypothetical protein
MMAGNPLPPPQDPEYVKAQADYRSELLRSGRSTDPFAGVLELLGGLVRRIFSGITRVWQKRG